LQSRGEVGRLPDHAALLRLAGSDEVPDHNHSGRDSETHPQRRWSRGCKLRHRVTEDERSPHSALGVVFVRARIAEINENAVAHVFGDKTAVTLDSRGAAAMIGADDVAQILGIELSRKGRRADEVAEHHGELPSFGGVLRRRRG
jgi:hypothetical protein